MGIAHIIGATGSAKKAGVQALNLVGKEGKEFKPGKLYIELKHFLDINQAWRSLHTIIWTAWADKNTDVGSCVCIS